MLAIVVENDHSYKFSCQFLFSSGQDIDIVERTQYQIKNNICKISLYLINIHIRTIIILFSGHKSVGEVNFFNFFEVA